MISRRRLIHYGALSAVLLAPSLAFAAKDPVYNSRGIAIQGYDPVAYFTDQQPRKGHRDYEVSHMGATFRFASAENKASFEANPDKYAPQYGGYCAWAVSHGYTASINPHAWTIDNDKLYLNYSLSVRAQWDADRANRIKLGDQNWPAVLNR